MSRTLPTEESLGLSPTEEELNTSVQADDSDIPIGDDDQPVLSVAKPGDDPARPKTEDEPPAEPEKVDEPGKTEEPKLVDVRAVQEARAEAREAKRQAAILEQRWNDFIAYQQQKPAPAQEQAAPEIPDLSDPQAVLEWARNELVARSEREATQTREQQEQAAQQQEFARLSDQVNREYTATAQTDPDLTVAHNALRKSLGEEMLAMGYSQQQALQEITRIENQHLVHIAKNGLEVGPYIKNLARARGWQPGAQQQAAGAAPKTDLAAVAAAQQRHQSLSDAPGGESIAPLDAKALARMSDKEFKAWMSKKGNEAKFDQIMGAG
jgi:hypothetical protein